MQHRCKKCNSLIHVSDREYCSNCKSESNSPKPYIPKPQLEKEKKDDTTNMSLAITTFNMLMNTVFK